MDGSGPLSGPGAAVDRDAAWVIANRHARVAVQPLGAMLSDASFVLGESQPPVRPLARAPWIDEADARRSGLPGLLQGLSGEWPCVPFGAADTDGLPQRWRPLSHAFSASDSEPHGHGSNQRWHLLERSADRLLLGIDYPEGHDVRCLRREVRLDPAQAAIELSLQVQVRRACRLPIALHPTLRLPDAPGAARLVPGRYAQAWTYPMPTEPGVSLLAPDQCFASIEQAPRSNGPAWDLGSLPLGMATEELVQLLACDGCMRLDNLAEGYRVSLRWNAEQLPHCMLWFSNRGRSSYPWLGRHLALGIEPNCAAFDLGGEVASRDNPMSRAGWRTAVDLEPGRSFQTRYRIEVTRRPS